MGFKIDTKRFQKVHDAKDHSILRHEDGHEIKIAKANLSPKLRAQLAEIPMADKAADTNPASNRATKEHKGQMMANGGMPVSAAENKQSLVDAANGVQSAPQVSYTAGPAAQGIAPGVSSYAMPAPPVDALAQSATAQGLKNEQDAQGDPSKAARLENMKAQAAKFNARQPMAEGGEAEPININLDAQPPQNVDASMLNPNAGQPVSGAINKIDPSVAEALSPGDLPYGVKPAYAKDPAAAAAPEASLASVEPKAQPQQPASQDQSDPYGTQAQMSALAGGINEQKQGIAGEAAATGQMGKEQQAMLDKQAAAQQDLIAHYHDQVAKLDNERSALQSDIANSHIDPNHYVGHMDTGKRIATTIGLILGGFGAGLAGMKSNPASDYLNQQIHNDIEAQKANLGKKQSLLEANMKQFGNLKDATEMTRAQMNDTVSTQLKAAAAKAQDPIAKARALQAAGQLDQQTAAARGSIAMRATMLQGAKNGTIAPETLVNFMIQDPEAKKAAMKELPEAQEAVKARDNAINAFDKVSQLNTIGSRVGSPLQSKSQIKAFTQPITAQLSKATAGRFTEQDAGYLETLWPNLADDEKTRLVKRAQMNKLINEKMNYPTLKAYNIDPAQFGQYGTNGQARIQMSAPVKKK